MGFVVRPAKVMCIPHVGYLREGGGGGEVGGCGVEVGKGDVEVGKEVCAGGWVVMSACCYVYG